MTDPVERSEEFERTIVAVQAGAIVSRRAVLALVGVLLLVLFVLMGLLIHVVDTTDGIAHSCHAIEAITRT